MNGVKEKLKKVKLVLTDVDGVLTDGKITYSSDFEIKSFNVKDGLICQYLLKEGIELGIITGRESDIVTRRAKELGFKYVYQGIKDKKGTFEEILKSGGFQPEEVCYLGDDINDIQLLRSVGFSVAPFDCAIEVAQIVDYTSSKKGGEGVFREIGDLILSLKGINFS